MFKKKKPVVSSVSSPVEPTPKRRRKRMTDEEVVKVYTELILDKRKELKSTPRKCGFVSLMDAGNLCNIGTVGNTVSDLLTLQEQGDKKDLVDFLDKHMPHIIAFSMIIGVVVLGLYVVSKMLGP